MKVTQDHLALAFPIKSPEDCVWIYPKLAELTDELWKGGDAVGTLHYVRFISLDDRIIYMLADFDGSLDQVLQAIATHLGSVIDPLLTHVSEAAPTPIAQNAGAFVKWAHSHHTPNFISYVRDPGATVQRIKFLARAAGLELDPAKSTQLPLQLIIPMKSRSSILAVRVAVEMLFGRLTVGADATGIVHFAHLVRLPEGRIGLFIIYDGPYDKYAQEFAQKLGLAFDLIFRFIKHPSPSRISGNTQLFTKWVKDHNLDPLVFYSAYPGLRVRDIKALLTESQ